MYGLLNDHEPNFSILPRLIVMLEGGRWNHLTNRNELNL